MDGPVVGDLNDDEVAGVNIWMVALGGHSALRCASSGLKLEVM